MPAARGGASGSRLASGGGPEARRRPQLFFERAEVDLLRELVLLRAVPERELEARDEPVERELVLLRAVEPLVLRALEPLVLRALDVLFFAPLRPVPDASFD